MKLTVWISDGYEHVERTGEQPWGRVPVKGEELSFEVAMPSPPGAHPAVGPTQQCELAFEVDAVEFPDGRPPVVKCFVPDCPPEELQALRNIGFMNAEPR